MKCITILLLCLVLTGCTRLAFTGDSITQLAAPTLKTHATDAFMVPDFAYYPGAATKEGVGMIAQFLGDHPGINAIVIELGTNDVGRDITDWQTYYDQILAEVANIPCIVLTTVSTMADLISPPPLVLAEDINAYINVQVSTHSNYRLVDWNAGVITEGNLTTDGIHPSQAGSDWLGSHDVAAVQSCHIE